VDMELTWSVAARAVVPELSVSSPKEALTYLISPELVIRLAPSLVPCPRSMPAAVPLRWMTMPAWRRSHVLLSQMQAVTPRYGREWM